MLMDVTCVLPQPYLWRTGLSQYPRFKSKLRGAPQVNMVRTVKYLLNPRSERVIRMDLLGISIWPRRHSKFRVQPCSAPLATDGMVKQGHVKRCKHTNLVELEVYFACKGGLNRGTGFGRL